MSIVRGLGAGVLALGRAISSVVESTWGRRLRQLSRQSGPAIEPRLEPLEERRMLSVYDPSVGMESYQTVESATVSAHLSASSDYGISYWSVDWGDGSGAQNVGEGMSYATISHAYADGPSSYTITAVAYENPDGQNNVASATASNSLWVDDVAPSQSLQTFSSTDEGSVVSLSNSASDPGSDTVTEWTVNWGDGGTDTLNVNQLGWLPLQHSYTEGPTNYTVTSTVVNEDGSHAMSWDVSINDVAPNFNFAAPDNVAEGSTYTLYHSYYDPGNDSITSWYVDWGDTTTTSLTGDGPLTHVYADGATSCPVTAVATDDDGHNYSFSTIATITDVAPQPVISGVDWLLSGESLTLHLNPGADPGDDMPLSWYVDWGDNSTDNIYNLANRDVVDLSHLYAATGDYTIHAQLFDDGGSGTYSASDLEVSVADAPPSLAVGGADSVDEGGIYSLYYSLYGITEAHVSNWRIDWGDSQIESSAQPDGEGYFTHSYGDNDPYSYAAIHATMTPSHGPAATADKIVCVNEVYATWGAVVPNDTSEGSPVVIYLTYSDPGDHVSDWTVDWGDGTTFSYGAGDTLTVTHVYADGYTGYPVNVTMADDDGGTSTLATISYISVNDVAPNLEIGGDPSAPQEGQTFTASYYSYQDPGSDTLVSWWIDWGDGSGGETIDASTSSATHVYADGDATYDLTWGAVDEDGTHTIGTRGQVVQNVAPSLSIGGVDRVALGSTYTLSASVDADPGNDTINGWFVDWGDTTTTTQSASGERSQTFEHTYATYGAYTIQAWTSDEDSSYWAYNSQTLEVTGALTLSVSGDLSVNEGEVYSLSYQLDGAVPSQISSWTIDWGDTTIETITGNEPLVHIYADDAASPRTVNVTLQTTYGDSVTADSIAVAINDVAPAQYLDTFTSVNEGEVVELYNWAYDPGDDTVTAWTVTWGDGGSDTLNNPDPLDWEWSLQHTYADGPTSYWVTSTVVNEDGTFSQSWEVTVNNVEPSFSFAIDPAVEGSTFTLGYSSGDPGTDSLGGWSITWGDGGSDSYGINDPMTHVYMDGPAKHTLTAVATDDDGNYTLHPVVIVDNAAAEPTISGVLATIAEQDVYSLDAIAGSDPGDDTPSDWIVDWGDGSLETISVSSRAATQFSHTYTAPGRHTIHAQMVDDDGTWVAQSIADGNPGDLIVEVTGVPSFSMAGPSSVDEGGLYSLSTGLTGADPSQVTNWTIEWGDGTITNTPPADGGFTHVYADEYPTSQYTITFDFDTSWESDIILDYITVTVNDASPTFEVGSEPSTLQANEVVTISYLSYQDAGDDSLVSWSIDWGDGDSTPSIDPATIVAYHTYLSAGIYTATATLIDDDGKTFSHTIQTPVGQNGFIVETLIGDAYEGGSPGKVRITRTGVLSSAVTVPLASTGEAVLGTDFVYADPITEAVITSITFAADEDTKDVLVVALADNLTEGGEVMQAGLGSGYWKCTSWPAPTKGWVYIRDDPTTANPNLDIYNGQYQATSQPISEDNEDQYGAFTVANLNDDDGNGVRDDIQTNNLAERDLMKLVVHAIPDDGMMILKRLSGTFSLWADDHKTVAGPTFVNNEIMLDATTDHVFWIEALSASASVGDIKLQLEFGGKRDVVQATGVWAYSSGNSLSNRNATQVGTMFGPEFRTCPENAAVRAQLAALGGTGIQVDSTGETYNVALHEWQVSPNLSSIDAQYRPRFDVASQIEGVAAYWDLPRYELDHSFTRYHTFPSGSSVDDPCSEPFIISSSLSPSGSVWAIDRSWGAVVGDPLTAIRENHRSFVRMYFGESPASGASRASFKEEWQSKTTAGAVTSPNEIKTGHMVFKTEPLLTSAKVVTTQLGMRHHAYLAGLVLDNGLPAQSLNAELIAQGQRGAAVIDRTSNPTSFEDLWKRATPIVGLPLGYSAELYFATSERGVIVGPSSSTGTGDTQVTLTHGVAIPSSPLMVYSKRDFFVTGRALTSQPNAPTPPTVVAGDIWNADWYGAMYEYDGLGTITFHLADASIFCRTFDTVPIVAPAFMVDEAGILTAPAIMGAVVSVDVTAHIAGNEHSRIVGPSGKKSGGAAATLQFGFISPGGHVAPLSAAIPVMAPAVPLLTLPAYVGPTTLTRMGPTATLTIPGASPASLMYAVANGGPPGPQTVNVRLYAQSSSGKLRDVLTPTPLTISAPLPPNSFAGALIKVNNSLPLSLVLSNNAAGILLVNGCPTNIRGGPYNLKYALDGKVWSVQTAPVIVV